MKFYTNELHKEIILIKTCRVVLPPNKIKIKIFLAMCYHFSFISLAKFSKNIIPNANKSSVKLTFSHILHCSIKMGIIILKAV